MLRKRDETCPISLDDLREWNYIDDTTFDTKLQLCLAAAISAAESYINQVVWPSSFVLNFSGVPREVEIQPYPVSSVAVSVDDAKLSPELYALNGDILRIDASAEGSATEITVKAGYEILDPDIKSAILLIASEMFRNPTDSVKQLPTASKLLLDPHRNANI